MSTSDRRDEDDSDSDTEEPRRVSRGGRALGESQTARARLVPEGEDLALNFVPKGVPLATGTLVDTRVVNAISVPAGAALRGTGTTSIAIPLGPWATLGVHEAVSSGEQAGTSSLLRPGLHSDEWVAEGDEEERRIKELADIRAAHRARTALAQRDARRRFALRRLLCVIALLGATLLAWRTLNNWNAELTQCRAGFGSGLELRSNSLFVTSSPDEAHFTVLRPSNDPSNDGCAAENQLERDNARQAWLGTAGRHG